MTALKEKVVFFFQVDEKTKVFFFNRWKFPDLINDQLFEDQLWL